MTASDYLVVERLEAKVEELRAENVRLRLLAQSYARDQAMTDIRERLKNAMHKESTYYAPQTTECIEVMREAIAEIERLTAQLPEGMQHCTIKFIECEKGHGRLTATNWLDHGCSQCEIERLWTKLRGLTSLVAQYELLLIPEPEHH